MSKKKKPMATPSPHRSGVIDQQIEQACNNLNRVQGWRKKKILRNQGQ